MRSLLVLVAAVVAITTSAACGGAPAADQPPEIVYGRDVCDHCQMIINDARFAAGYTTVDGPARRFDDIGDLLAYGTEHAELDAATVWVHDVDTEVWVAAADAWFLVGTHQTPMASGIVAYADRGRAHAEANASGTAVYSWDELRRQDLAPMMDHDMTMHD